MDFESRKRSFEQTWRTSELIKYCEAIGATMRRWEDETHKHVDFVVPDSFVKIVHGLLCRSGELMWAFQYLQCECSTAASCNCKPFGFNVIKSSTVNKNLEN